jgi:hypothetical protein
MISTGKVSVRRGTTRVYAYLIGKVERMDDRSMLYNVGQYGDLTPKFANTYGKLVSVSTTQRP